MYLLLLKYGWIAETYKLVIDTFQECNFPVHNEVQQEI